MIIQATKKAGIHIPHFCYHEGLSIVASCRICLVEVEGIPKLIPACQTPVRDGMVVHTLSPKTLASQKQVMEYLLIITRWTARSATRPASASCRTIHTSMATPSRGLKRTSLKSPRRTSARGFCFTTTGASCARGACGLRGRSPGRASCISMVAGTRKRSIFPPGKPWTIRWRGTWWICARWARCSTRISYSSSGSGC